jgi:hypothetical protein
LSCNTTVPDNPDTDPPIEYVSDAAAVAAPIPKKRPTRPANGVSIVNAWGLLTPLLPELSDCSACAV